ncbi:MAG: hypothetical protein AABY26_03325 [Nanoarchaeota archaeon]
MLFIRTKHDLATEYTFAWSELILQEAEEKGISVITIEREDINFQNLSKRIDKVRPKFIFFNGHGGKDCFYDNKSNVLIDLKTCLLLKNTITFARSCETLAELGPEAVKMGCRAFVGYGQKFLVPRWHVKTCKPLQDPVAKPIMECSNLVAGEIIQGKSVAEAVEKSHLEMTRTAEKYIYSSDPHASAILFALVNNDLALGFCGDENAVF